MSINDLNPNSKLWLYQSNRPLNETEITWLNEQLEEFTKQWAAHGNQLKAAGEVLNPYFVALAVDLTHENASGCSIDASVRFIKSVGAELNVDFFNRLKMLVEDENGVQKLIPFKQLQAHPTYSIFNPLVETVGQLNSQFKLKVASFLNLQN
jgi:hypothetical protein